MEPLMIALGWVGIFAPTALGAIGSAYGCAVAGAAAAGGVGGKCGWPVRGGITHGAGADV